VDGLRMVSMPRFRATLRFLDKETGPRIKGRSCCVANVGDLQPDIIQEDSFGRFDAASFTCLKIESGVWFSVADVNGRCHLFKD
jgi:hypothetical protein